MSSHASHEEPVHETTTSTIPIDTSSTSTNPSDPISKIDHDNPSPKIENNTTHDSTAHDSTTPRTSPPDTSDLKKCWICFADESEDTTPTTWRNPCPCALVAHESCLLDWIADMESTDRKSSNADTTDPKCPQCKSPILLHRSLDPIVALSNALERMAASLVIPAAGTLTASLIYSAFCSHGTHSVFMIFGSQDAMRILAPLSFRSRFQSDWSPQEIVADVRQHLRLYLGLPFITPALLLSRTELFDHILPLLPLAFSSMQGVGRRWDVGSRKSLLEMPTWPPSAAFVFSLLPYVRMAYNEYYKRVWSKRVQDWDKALEPRAGREAEVMNDEGDMDDDDMHDHEAMFELRLDANIFPNWRGGAQEQVAVEQPAARVDPVAVNPVPVPVPAPATAPAPALAPEHPAADAPVANLAEAAEPVGADPRPPQQNQPQDPPQQGEPAPVNNDAANGAPVQQGPPPANNAAIEGAQIQREQRLSFSTIGLAEKVLGSLLFPTASALAGQALLAVLPSSWTSPSGAPTGGLLFRRFGLRPAGLLQERWGRSIVGGCLLVVFKDALMLYVKWRMVQQHRQRRVLDYQGVSRIKA